MRALLPVVCALLLVSSCGEGVPLPERDHWIAVETGTEAVLPGRAFPLTVTRMWRRDLAAAVWDDRALAPLDLRLETLTREEDDERVRETRHFRAYVFALEDVVVPPVPFAARPAGGGEAKTVHAPSITVRVRPTLLPSAPGVPELPGGPLRPSRAPWLGIGLGLAVLLGLGITAARRRRPRPVAEPAAEEPPAPAPHEIALERLARLGANGAAVAAVTEVVRAYVADRYDVPAPFLSTEEVLAADGIEEDAADRLARLLALGDRTKFAAHAATPSERQAHLKDAERFVRRTAEGAAS